MDFELVTRTVLKGFEDQGIRHAVIGGFALGLWGATRATIDLDFLLMVEDLQKAEGILAEFYYRRTYKSENVAQYVSDLAPYGQIDVLLAFRKISLGMLERSKVRKLEDGLAIRTLIPEDIIGLKVQAMCNDSLREAKERADIEALLEARRGENEGLDWELLGEYFELFNRGEYLHDLSEKYGPSH